MPRFFRKTHEKLAQPPGTVEFLGERKVEHITLSVIDYDQERLEEKDVENVEECFRYRDTKQISWVNVNGLHDTEIIKKLGDHYGLHPLILEDIVHAHQRPKVEDYEDYIFVVARMLHYAPGHTEVKAEQLSIVIGPNYVLSFQERPGDVFDPVRQRIRNPEGRFRRLGPDYLAYALLDAIVDDYFVMLEQFANEIEGLEDELVQQPTPELLERIHHVKRETIFLRSAVGPLREVVASLERGDSKIITKDTAVFYRDVYDHTIQAIDAVNAFRDMLSGLQDLYLSSVSNRMNEVMKVLTIIATIFVPLTFVAGIFGMNFTHMPELQWKWSYPVFWVVIVAIGVGMVTFFRRKRWL
jgi:magnesium transporter